MLGSPHRDAVLQVGSHKTGLEGLAHVPVPADLGSFPCSPAHGCFLGWQHQVLAHSELLLHGHPKCFSSAPAPLDCLCPAKPLLRAAPATLCVIGKAIPEPWAQAEPSLMHTPHPRPAPGHGAADHNSLAVSIWPVPLAPHSPACTARPGHCGARGVCPGALGLAGLWAQQRCQTLKCYGEWLKHR